LQDEALAKVNKQYNIVRSVGHRTTVTEIDFEGLVPATMHCTLAEATVTFVEGTLNNTEFLQKKRIGKWPVWVRNTARPADGSSISMQQFLDSGADMWMRGLELRKTGDHDMNTGAASTHDNEWLSCGSIRKSFITNVFPFDGETLHLQKTHDAVTSTGSLEIYVFNWDEWMWQRNPDMTDYRPFRLANAVDRHPNDTPEEEV
jgi:hypothetical protein